MVWFVITQIFSTVLDIIRLGRLSNQEKDLEIMILRHQLDILARKQKKPIKPSQAEKLSLAILTYKLKQSTDRTTNQLHSVIRIFQPATVLKWHRQLVHRKWTQDNKGHVGRPKISQDTQKLVLRLAKENGRWGYGKIEGKLKKLGIKISLTSIRNILNRHDIVPIPIQSGLPNNSGNLSGTLKQMSKIFAFSCVTTIANTLPTLTTFLNQKEYMSSPRQFVPLMRMPTLKDGFARFVKNAWTTFGFSMKGTCSGFCVSSSTTMK